MSADVWFRRDIANALLSSYENKRQTIEMVGGARDTQYLAGARDMTAALALVFGISPAEVIPSDMPQLKNGNR